MRDELFRLELAGHDRLEQQRSGHCVDEPRRDGDVLRPEFLEVQGHARPVHADVGDVAAGADDFLTDFERSGYADRFDSDIHSFAGSHGHDFFDGLAIGAVDHRGRPELLRHLETVVIEIDDDDVRRSIELCRQQCRQSDRARTDDGHHISRFDAAVEHAAFIAGRQDVAEHHHRVFVCGLGNGIKTRVGKRNPDELGLRSVNRVAQNPAALLAMGGHAAPAKLTLSARRDARDQDSIALVKAADTGSDLIDDPDPFMAQDATFRDGGHVSFQDVQIRTADGGLGYPHHGVGRFA